MDWKSTSGGGYMEEVRGEALGGFKGKMSALTEEIANFESVLRERFPNTAAVVPFPGAHDRSLAWLTDGDSNRRSLYVLTGESHLLVVAPAVLMVDATKLFDDIIDALEEEEVSRLDGIDAQIEHVIGVISRRFGKSP